MTEKRWRSFLLLLHLLEELECVRSTTVDNAADIARIRFYRGW